MEPLHLLLAGIIILVVLILLIWLRRERDEDKKEAAEKEAENKWLTSPWNEKYTLHPRSWMFAPVYPVGDRVDTWEQCAQLCDDIPNCTMFGHDLEAAKCYRSESTDYSLGPRGDYNVVGIKRA